MYIFFTLYLLYHLLFPLKTYFCACAIYTIYKVSFEFFSFFFPSYIVVPEVFVTHPFISNIIN